MAFSLKPSVHLPCLATGVRVDTISRYSESIVSFGSECSTAQIPTWKLPVTRWAYTTRELPLTSIQVLLG